jgi:hemolysin III
MGWICLVAIEPLLQNLAPAGFMWLLAGGIFYTVGIVFYALDHKKHYFHAIWHLFVLAGSVCHYFSILFHIL